MTSPYCCLLWRSTRTNNWTDWEKEGLLPPTICLSMSDYSWFLLARIKAMLAAGPPLPLSLLSHNAPSVLNRLNQSLHPPDDGLMHHPHNLKFCVLRSRGDKTRGLNSGERKKPTLVLQCPHPGSVPAIMIYIHSLGWWRAVWELKHPHSLYLLAGALSAFKGLVAMMLQSKVWGRQRGNVTKGTTLVWARKWLQNHEPGVTGL